MQQPRASGQNSKTHPAVGRGIPTDPYNGECTGTCGYVVGEVTHFLQAKSWRFNGDVVEMRSRRNLLSDR